jgi:glucosamine--fructose-6-phosphate aminotransferase (isomerizing)
MVSNIKEVKARGGYVLLITGQDYEVDLSCCDQVMRLPIGDDAFGPMLGVIVLQMLAYFASIARGCDVYKPRNLAKSVTVE